MWRLRGCLLGVPKRETRWLFHRGHSQGCQILRAGAAAGIGMGRRVRVAGSEQHGVGAGHLPKHQAWDLIGTADCQGERPRCATARRGRGWRDIG